MDGIDVGLVFSDGKRKIEFGPTLFVPYDRDFQLDIAAAIHDATGLTGRSERTLAMNRVEQAITDRHGDAVEDLLSKFKIEPNDVDYIGFHGQTVLHKPEDGLTIQLGLGQALADRVGIDVIYDFRANDMAHGGQGAPLVPVYHRVLAERLEKKLVVFVNIGGISNVSFVGERELIAFDCGPGNVLLDQWMTKTTGMPFDEGGTYSAGGNVVPQILDDLLENPFFAQTPPKSLDRLDFQLPDFIGVDGPDAARTLCAFSAEGIARSARFFPSQPELWVICGGGARNSTLMDELALRVPGGGTVISAREIGFDADFIEAQAFGYLAIRSALALPLTYPKTTNCAKPVSGGVLVPCERRWS